MSRISKQQPQLIGRRRLLGTIASTTLAAMLDRSGAAAQSANSKVLVAYFTRTGNARVIARQIRRALQADLFEIEPVDPYPEDYEATVSQAQREQDNEYRPPLKAAGPDVGSHDVVFLGFPIWDKARRR
jgi:hypothetical protein